MAFATRAQFYRYGLRAEALQPQARTIVSVDPTTDIIVLRRHGLVVGDPVYLQVSVGGTVPAGLSVTATYYAIPVDGDVVKLAATPSDAAGGVAVNITAAGAGVIGLICSLEPVIDDQLEADAATIAGALKAYRDLVQPYPLEVVMANCHLSAFHVASTLGMLNPAQPTQDAANLAARYDAAQKTLARWRAGETLPPGVVDSTPDVLEMGTVSDVEAAPGWTTESGGL